MIRSLHIKNLATIEDLEIEFKEGFSILTGETGAGKSIIIDGIKLVLGEKAPAELIRTGAREATVAAVFCLPQGKHGAGNLAGTDSDEVFVQRQISGEGSGKAYVNGVLVPARKLRDFSSTLIDIYGQNDHIFLLQLENHLRYLDQYAGLVQEREQASALARHLRQLLRQKKELETRRKEREQRLDFLDFQIKEIESSQLRPGEWEELQSERNILKNAEKIASLVESALELSHLREDSVTAFLFRLQDSVRELSRYEPGMQSYGESLNQAAIAVKELSDYLIKFREKQNLGPERLDALEARLNVLEKLRRKYGGTSEDILLFLGKIKGERSELVQCEERQADLEAEINRTLAAYTAVAEKLGRLRREGARRLESRMEKEISLLGMKRARFEVKIVSGSSLPPEPGRVRESGLDDVEFLISPNPGEELRPLRKIASGGELSRIMLALKTVGKEKERLKTLIFDEIDSGIGGKTAECIAAKLLELSGRHQVICITHLPQIASFAPHHYRIDKKVEKERTYTTVEELGFEARVAEISRLLSGSRITSTSLQNAKEMLLHNLGKGKGKKPHDQSSTRGRQV
jgi:DNA repair protein RecN (Recombination protein N)